MNRHNTIKNVLIKIIFVLLFLYITLFCIRLSIPTEYDLTVGYNYKYAEDEVLEKIDVASYEEDTETFGTLENISFTVDITVADNMSNSYVGNTATVSGYSGIIEFKLSDVLKEINSTSIEVGNTYVIEVSPMMETNRSGFPLVTATNISLATAADIVKLEETKQDVSTFRRKSIEYSSMDLTDIINDANISYATWTNDEIKEYCELIRKKGYTDSYENKSYVCIREDIRKTYGNYQ